MNDETLKMQVRDIHKVFMMRAYRTAAFIKEFAEGNILVNLIIDTDRSDSQYNDLLRKLKWHINKAFEHLTNQTSYRRRIPVLLEYQANIIESDSLTDIFDNIIQVNLSTKQ